MAVRLSYKPRIWREAASLILAARSTIPVSESKNKKEIVLPLDSMNTKCTRQDNSNYNILLLKRVSTMKFMPNVVVFPGGQLDPSDMSIEWLKYFEGIGLNKSALIESLRINGPRPFILRERSEFDKVPTTDAISPILPLDIAFRLCAIRETFEECGVLITRSASSANKDLSLDTSTCSVAEWSESEIRYWQEKVMQDGKNFLNLCKEKNLCPNLWALHEWNDWLTPTHEFPKRFDTLFYIVLVDNLQYYLLSKNENTELMLRTPFNILDEYYNLNKMNLVPPQHFEISRLVNVNDFDKLASFAVERESLGLQCWFPVLMKTSDGQLHLYPGDDMYPQVPDFMGINPKLSTPMTVEEARMTSQNLCRGEVLTNDNHVFIKCNIKMPFGHLSPLIL